MLEQNLNFPHDIPSSSEIQLGTLKGRDIVLDTCNTSMLAYRNLCANIKEVKEKKGIEKRALDGELISTSVDPCQKHQSF